MAKRRSRIPADRKGPDDALVNGHALDVLSGAQALATIDAIEAEARQEAAQVAKPNGRPPDEGMVRVLVDHHEAQVADAVRAALATDDCIFRRGGVAVRVVRPDDEPAEAAQPATPKGRRRGLDIRWPREMARIADAGYAYVRELIARRCYLYQHRRAGDVEVESHRCVPDYLPAAVRENPVGLRPLRGILPGPTVDAQARLINAVGYDAATGCYLAEALPGLELPDRPTRDDALAAAETLAELVQDFPFVASADRSRWLCLLLAACARHLMDRTPLGLIVANKAGTGKSQLAEIISIIAHGPGRQIVMSWPEGEGHHGSGNEIRKRLASLLHGGATLACIDNLPRGEAFGCPEIDAFLTADSYSDRRLGVNDGSRVGGPNRCLLLVTGNAVRPLGDTADRSLVVELRTDHPSPRSRSPEEFHVADLPGYAAAHRAELLGSVLTIWRAWIAAGCPDPPGEAWGSFGQFASRVVAMVRWLGWPDPIAGRARRAAEDDPETETLAELLVAWRARFGETAVKAGALVELIDGTTNPGPGCPPTEADKTLRDALLALCRCARTPTVQRLGVKLKAYRRCPVEVIEDGRPVQLRLADDEDSHRNTHLYRVETV